MCPWPRGAVVVCVGRCTYRLRLGCALARVPCLSVLVCTTCVVCAVYVGAWGRAGDFLPVRVLICGDVVVLWRRARGCGLRMFGDVGLLEGLHLLGGDGGG